MPRNPDPGTYVWGRFPSTRWSLIIRAGSPGSPQARAAPAELCSVCWYPIYTFIRPKGNRRDQALDLTQEFFARLLEKGIFAAAELGKGRFRAFLRADCQHVLIDQFRRMTAWGGGLRTVSIDAHREEDRCRFEPVDTLMPDRLFDRPWALILLSRVLALLVRENDAKGHSELFEQLNVILTQGKGVVPAATLAAELGTTEEAVHMAGHRLEKTLSRDSRGADRRRPLPDLPGRSVCALIESVALENPFCRLAAT
jgi:RNA polymerase sigma-70 factor (ECF subfamily)